jgi:hypothetical protein
LRYLQQNTDRLQALSLYHATMIYSRTSMFPGQRIAPLSNGPSTLQADTEHRCSSIVEMAAAYITPGLPTQHHSRHIIFPLFLAGMASTNALIKTRAVSVMTTLTAGGIGQNTFMTRTLLQAVIQEQNEMLRMGRRMEEVDWLELAEERDLRVANCGL